MDTITVKEMFEKGIPEGYVAMLQTSRGEVEVDYIYDGVPGLRAHCPKENGGWGLSFCVADNEPLNLRKE